MLLVIDMGNSNIEVGIIEGEKILMSERISTDLKKTSTEYAVLLNTILRLRGIDTGLLEGGIISSVVPSLTFPLKEAVKLAAGFTPLAVAPGMKTGLKIRIDDPKTLGADMVVAAVAAIELYGAPNIVIDMGTATTITGIDEKEQFIGGAIVPGVAVSLSALANSTSQLPMIGLEKPGKAIGTNTVDCMKSGVIYGQASLLDGMIDRMTEEMSGDPKVIATGGLAKVIVPYCRHRIILDNELMLHGLRMIWEKNR